MSTEQREQSKLGVATFIVATGIVFIQSDNATEHHKNTSILIAFYAVVMLAMFISILFAFLYILGKAAELRDKPPRLLLQKLLVSHREKFYSIAVTLYIPFIVLLGGFLALVGWIQYLDKLHAPTWVAIAGPILLTAILTWFWPTKSRSMK